jgi:hypothetical protein
MPFCRACRHAVHSSCRLTVVFDRGSEPIGSLKACGSSSRCCTEDARKSRVTRIFATRLQTLVCHVWLRRIEGKVLMHARSSCFFTIVKSEARYRRRQLNLSARNAGLLGFGVGAILTLMHQDSPIPGSWIERLDRALAYPQCLAKVGS